MTRKENLRDHMTDIELILSIGNRGHGFSKIKNKIVSLVAHLLPLSDSLKGALILDLCQSHVGYNPSMKKLLTILLAFFACVAIADSNPYAAESSIYKVEVPSPNNDRMGLGTGVLIAWDKILTNCHVLTKSSGWPRVVHRKTGQQFYVTKHYTLGNLDACVLVGGFSGTPVQLAMDFQEGENVWIFGFPSGLPTVGQGTVKGLVDTDAGKSLLLAAFCAPGSSGGPVINSKGQLVGLNWGVFRYQNQCLSIPAAVLQPYLTGVRG